MESHRQFRFGVVGEHAADPPALLATARQAERLGYHTFLLRDHFVREPFGDQLAPMVALAAVAAATRTLRIGTLVLANDYRHPVILAKEAATLDALSGGRFELGLGAGWLREEYDRAGIRFESGGTRVDRLAEALTVLKGLLRGEEVTFRGDHYMLSNLTTFPPTGQRPHPPLLVGAGSRRMLQLAGREADTVGILPKALSGGGISAALSERTPEATARKVAWVRETAAARSREVELSMVISPVLTGDPDRAAERFAADRGWSGLPAATVRAMPSVFLGPAGAIAEQMLARREQYGFSYYVVSDADLVAFAPVLELLTGR